ncbi:aquaporin [Candidatus Dojkabacteria bacterium]|nr:aquaporin [Candidatus Dojkabacteria bacterium]
MKLTQKVGEYFAESLGTFLFFAIIYMSAVFGGSLAAFAVGLGFGALVLALGSYTEAHFNPVLTVAANLTHAVRGTKKMVPALMDTMSYLLAQLIGGIAAYQFISWVRESIVDIQLAAYNTTGSVSGEVTRDQISDQFPVLSNSFLEGSADLSFMLEAVLTFFFVFTVISVVRSEKVKQYGGIVAGLALLAITAFSNQITGASFNPMRSLVPALFEGGDPLKNVWLYILAPLAGGLVAVGAYLLLEALKSGEKRAVNTVISAAPKTKKRSTRKRKK